jgi:hypothetical protein
MSTNPRNPRKKLMRKYRWKEISIPIFQNAKQTGIQMISLSAGQDASAQYLSVHLSIKAIISPPGCVTFF